MLYPNATCEKIIVMTAHIPRVTAIAVARGLHNILPVRFTRDEFEVCLNEDQRNNPMFQAIAGFVDEGLKLARLTPY
jgi:hypothetical protein